MSRSSIRVELRELLTFLFPEKQWRSLVSAQELAQFTIANVADYAIEERAQRALELAHEIKRRERVRP